MTELTVSQNSKCAGAVKIADEVLAIIAGTAALEAEGVAGAAGNIPGEIAEAFGVKNLAKGVKVEVADGCVSIDISLLVKFGYKIKDVSEDVQRRVKNAVETMTGLNASAVNINVTGVITNK